VSIELIVFADHWQILVVDEASAMNFADAWTDPDDDRPGISVGRDAISVAAEVNVNVGVRVAVTDARPSVADVDYDYLAEASIDVPTGHLVVMGFLSNAARFAVPAGPMRILIGRSNLAAAYEADIDSDRSDETMERLSLWAWPDATSAPVVLKRWRPTSNTV
jgi:hypothetical protein